MSLYKILKESFRRNAERYVVDGELRYGELLAELQSIEGQRPAGSLALLELDSGRQFLLELLSALANRQVFCPIARGSCDLERAREVLRSSLNAAGRDQNGLRFEAPPGEKWPELNEQVRLLCPEGGFVRFSSGTTADAKGVLISAASALDRIHLAESIFSARAGEKMLFLMPMPYHFVTVLLLMLKQGVCFTEKGQEAELVYGTPFQFRSLVSAELSSLRLAVSSSTQLPQSVADSFLAAQGVPICESYGVIEVGLPIAGCRGRRDCSEQSERSVSAGSNSQQVPVLGRLQQGYEMKLVDEADGSGTLCLRGPGMFDAYLNPFRTREEALVDGWFETGDIVSVSSDGDIAILGRKSSAIHLGGFKIFPVEIEEVINSHPEVIESQVFAEAHELYGSVLLARVVVSSAMETGQLRQYCKQRLGLLKTPKRFDFVASLEKTSTGKLLRRNGKQGWECSA